MEYNVFEGGAYEAWTIKATLRKDKGTMEVALWREGWVDDTHYLTIHKDPLQVEHVAVGQSERVTMAGFANVRRAGPYVQWSTEEMLSVTINRILESREAE